MNLDTDLPYWHVKTKTGKLFKTDMPQIYRRKEAVKAFLHCPVLLDGSIDEVDFIFSEDQALAYCAEHGLQYKTIERIERRG